MLPLPLYLCLHSTASIVQGPVASDVNLFVKVYAGRLVDMWVVVLLDHAQLVPALYWQRFQQKFRLA